MPNRRGKIQKYKLTPGVAIDSIGKKIDHQINSVEGINSDDTKNRRYVVNKILENMKNGLTEEETLDLIMKDKIVEQFKYLENNGCNIKKCFINWARGYKNKKEKQIEK